jgi:hypothetical protein
MGKDYIFLQTGQTIINAGLKAELNVFYDVESVQSLEMRSFLEEFRHPVFLQLVQIPGQKGRIIAKII